MLETILNQADGIVTFAFLFGTVCLMYPADGTDRAYGHTGILISVWTLCYTAVYKPLDLRFGYMSVYIALMIAFGVSGIFLFFRSRLRERVFCSFLYLALIVSVKAFLRTLQGIGVIAYGTEAGTLIFYILYYVTLLLCLLFFIFHPVFFNTNMPLRETMLMMVCAAFSVMVPLLNQWGHRNQSDLSFLTVLSDLLSIAMILLIYYLAYAMLGMYERLLEAGRLSQRQQAEISALHHTKVTVNRIRQERHELKNTYFYINSLVKEKKYAQLERYLDENISYRMTSLEEFRTGNHLLDILLTQKVAEAREGGIRVVCHLLLPGEMAVSDEELCSLLLNLWNNAIEACRTIKDPAIDFSITGSHGYANIVLRNSAASDVFAGNSDLSTTKKDKENHGIGLKLIRRIVRKNNGILRLHMDGDDFVAEVMLPVHDPSTAHAVPLP